MAKKRLSKYSTICKGHILTSLLAGVHYFIVDVLTRYTAYYLPDVGCRNNLLNTECNASLGC